MITDKPTFLHKRLLAIIVIAFALGAGTTVLLTGGFNQHNSNLDEAAINQAIKSYIEQNPAFVFEVLTNYNTQEQEQSYLQTINLIKADDNKAIMGNPDGDVTIYEFSDYNCGYCKRAFTDLANVLEEDGNIRLVIKEFPILSEGSLIAARYALAAAELGYYKDFHTALMRWPGAVDQGTVDKVIADSGIAPAALQAELDKGAIDAIIENNIKLAQSAQIGGTPAFVIGDRIVPGAVSADGLRELVANLRQNRQ